MQQPPIHRASLSEPAAPRSGLPARPGATIRRHLRHGMLPQLAVFEAAARLGSFTRAAQSLHLAQPTVSTQLRKLSDALELPLFEQIGKKVHLTPAGRALYQGCVELFATFERIEHSLSGLRSLQSGRLRLAVGASAAPFVSELLAQYAQRYPQVNLSLQILNRHGLIERLRDNADDLYLFVHPPSDMELVCQPVGSLSFAVHARADHPLAGQRDIPLQALADQPLLVRESGAGTRALVDGLFADAGLEPRIRMELASDSAIVQAASAGLGIAVLPCLTPAAGALPSAGGLAMLDVVGLPLRRRWQFVYPVGKQVSAAASAFIELVRGRLASAGGTPDGRAPAGH